jgi:hypothetical protein
MVERSDDHIAAPGALRDPVVGLIHAGTSAPPTTTRAERHSLKGTALKVFVVTR